MAVSGTIQGVRIAGIACAVPETVVRNDAFFARFGEEQMQKFEKMVGVKERRMASLDDTTSDFACRAMRELSDCWSSEDVDALLFVSQTPDYQLPATACVLQYRLGIKKSCVAFDINLGCSGFVYAIFIASSLLKSGGIRKVAILGGDCSLKPVSPRDPAAAPLFGDCGFATVLERDETAPPIDYSFCTDGKGYKAIIEPGVTYGGRMAAGYTPDGLERDVAPLLKPSDDGTRKVSEVFMDGMEVFNFTINEVPDLIKEQMSRNGLTAKDVDFLVLHQANCFVLKQVALATGFSMKKVPVCMDRYGNTSSSSIPLALCDLNARSKESGVDLGAKKVLMSGFGVGLSWGTLLCDFDFSACRGIFVGAESFKEGVL